MKRLIIITYIMSQILIVGCKSPNVSSWSGWQKIKEDDTFKYMLYESKDISDEKPIYIVFPGLNDGIEEHISQSVKKYLETYGKSGIIIAPYVNYEIDSGKYYVSRIISSLERIQHDESKVYLLGCSCGAVSLLTIGEQFDPAGMILVVAGAYKDAGGLPSTELPMPNTDNIWFLNGYDKSTYLKYGILYDGTVYVNPVKSLVEEIGSPNVQLSLFEGLDHGNTYKVLNASSEYLDWLSSLSK